MEMANKDEMQRAEAVRKAMEGPLQRLAEILDSEALEIIPGTGEDEGEVYIPYMMNDALEYILVLENGKITGEFDPNIPVIEADVEFQENEDSSLNLRYVLILKQADNRRCAVFFDQIREEVQTYPCHEIGHFWVPGAEQWRRLVYILGTIHDKYHILGEQYCNEREQELMRLIEFVPLRDWSPIDESIADRYRSTKDGLKTMMRMAEQAGDQEYLKQLKQYRRFPLKNRREQLHRALQDPERWKLWNHLWQKTVASQEGYTARDYGEEENQRIRELREHIDQQLREKGYKGNYPEYWGWKTRREKSELILITVAEDHPFTKLDRSDYAFDVKFMVSVGPVKKLAPQGLPADPERNCFRWNLGFFNDSEVKGDILSLDRLLH